MRRVVLEQSRVYTHDVVLCRVELLKETGGTPAASKDDQSLLCRIVWKLEARSAFLMSDIVETCPGKDHSANGESANCLKSPSPSREADGLANEMGQKRRKGRWIRGSTHGGALQGRNTLQAEQTWGHVLPTPELQNSERAALCEMFSIFRRECVRRHTSDA